MRNYELKIKMLSFTFKKKQLIILDGYKFMAHCVAKM